MNNNEWVDKNGLREIIHNVAGDLSLENQLAKLEAAGSMKGTLFLFKRMGFIPNTCCASVP